MPAWHGFLNIHPLHWNNPQGKGTRAMAHQPSRVDTRTIIQSTLDEYEDQIRLGLVTTFQVASIAEARLYAKAVECKANRAGRRNAI